MGSKHPRLGVARDPELERALIATKPLLSERETRSAAAQVRALALRAATSLIEEADDPAAEFRRRLREKYETIPAMADPRTFRAPSDKIDPDDPTPATDALRWAQGKG